MSWIEKVPPLRYCYYKLFWNDDDHLDVIGKVLSRIKDNMRCQRADDIWQASLHLSYISSTFSVIQYSKQNDSIANFAKELISKSLSYGWYDAVDYAIIAGKMYNTLDINYLESLVRQSIKDGNYTAAMHIASEHGVIIYPESANLLLESALNSKYRLSGLIKFLEKQEKSLKDINSSKFEDYTDEAKTEAAKYYKSLKKTACTQYKHLEEKEAIEFEKIKLQFDKAILEEEKRKLAIEKEEIEYKYKSDLEKQKSDSLKQSMPVNNGDDNCNTETLNKDTPAQVGDHHNLYNPYPQYNSNIHQSGYDPITGKYYCYSNYTSYDTCTVSNDTLKPSAPPLEEGEVGYYTPYNYAYPMSEPQPSAPPLDHLEINDVLKAKLEHTGRNMGHYTDTDIMKVGVMNEDDTYGMLYTEEGESKVDAYQHIPEEYI